KQPIIFSRVFQISCSFGRQNLFHEKSNQFQDFTIPALDQEFLHICPELRVFTMERNSFTEEDTWSTKAESEELSGQKIKPVPTKETSAIPKIKVATSSPKVERGPIKETYAAPKPKLPRSLACNLDQSTKAESEELWGQKIKPVPTTETSVIPKIKVATSSPKVEKGPIKRNLCSTKTKAAKIFSLHS
ncbi:unnamed protein product, partial [Larinioides sclopetarius]